MKKLLIISFLLFLSIQFSFSQTQIKGEIVADTLNVKILKVWGTHYERGFAYGYLVGDQMVDLYENYLLPAFGGYINLARQIIEDGEDIVIRDEYIDEAQGIVAGIDSANFPKADFDYIDVLLSNSYLDLFGFFKTQIDVIPPGCSALMRWGDATVSTDLDGKSVISRHVDWSNNQVVTRNQVIVAHIPEEEDEQPWIMIGFTGQISALSGLNDYGVAFMHSMSDFSGSATQGVGYEPIWFALRNGLEKKDFNNDDKNDVNDIRDALSANKFGYAQASIISTCFPAENIEFDTLIAMVAEVACLEPYLTFRYNNYEDLISGDNLYAANFQIKRNDAQNYCSRYNNVVNNFGDGTNISSIRNWEILINYSQGSGGGGINVQFMQFIPELNILRIAVAKGNTNAHDNDSVEISIDSLFEIPTVTIQNNQIQDLSLLIFPNPAKSEINISVSTNQQDNFSISIFDIYGRKIYTITENETICRKKIFNLNIENFQTGIYYIKLQNENKIMKTSYFIKI